MNVIWRGASVGNALIIDQYYLLFSLKLPFSTKIYLKDLSTILFKHAILALC